MAFGLVTHNKLGILSLLRRVDPMGNIQTG
jgi:hypothetical protein